MKKIKYYCDICEKEIVDTSERYEYKGTQYDVYLGNSNGFQLHQQCISIFAKAKEAAIQAFKKYVQRETNSCANHDMRDWCYGCGSAAACTDCCHECNHNDKDNDD